VGKVIEVYKKLGVDTITNDLINKYFNKANECLTKLTEKGLDVEPLKEYSQKLSGRKF
jgi:hypothetical protein